MYHNKIFRGISNTANGEVGTATEFHYRQRGDVLWATYSGGGIRWGTMTGLVGADGCLSFAYQHVNENGEIMTGRCLSRPEVLPDGRIRLHESWRWTSGDGSSGESVVEEV